MLEEYSEKNYYGEHIEAAALTGEIQGRKIWHSNRAIRALQSANSADAFSLAERMQNCQRGSVCSSFWCPRCRHRAAKGLQGRLESRVLGEFGDDHEAAQKRLLFATVLFDLVSLHDPTRVRSVISDARRDLKALNRSFDNKLWLQGAFELELIDIKKLMEWEGGNHVKKDTVKAMLGWDGEKPTLYTALTLVHAHFLLDRNGVEAREVSRWFSSRYKAPRQSYCTGIQAGQTLEGLCWKLGSYPFKDRVQFNMTFESQGYRNGGYFSNFELSKLVLLHDQLCRNGFKNLLIGSNNFYRSYEH